MRLAVPPASPMVVVCESLSIPLPVPVKLRVWALSVMLPKIKLVLVAPAVDVAFNVDKLPVSAILRSTVMVLLPVRATLPVPEILPEATVLKL